MQQPIVSIVMPCYNDGLYLQEALASCRTQTYKNIEILIIDDGSDDPDTVQLLSNVQGDNVRCLRTDHLGPAGARNAAIRQACGKYILPLDADDCILPPYIENAVSLMERSPEVGIVYCQAERFGKEHGPWQLPPYSVETLLQDNCIFVTALFRRDDWQQVGGFCEEFIHGFEDYDFWLSLIELGREVYQFPEVWFRYRIKKRSRSTKINDNEERQMETYTLLYKRHRALYQAHEEAYTLGLRRRLVELQTRASQGFFTQVLRYGKRGVSKRLARFVWKYK